MIRAWEGVGIVLIEGKRVAAEEEKGFAFAFAGGPPVLPMGLGCLSLGSGLS